VRHVPIQVHWSLPLGLFIFGRFRYLPIFWACLLLLILWHEAGHAIVVRACRKRVTGILLHGGGGLCFWRGEATPVQRSLIAWGGVWAQALIFFAMLAVVHLWGRLLPPWAIEVRSALLDVNAMLIALNLLPVLNLDGVQAWPLFPRLYRRWRRRQIEARGEQIRAQLETLHHLDDAEPPPEVQRMLEETVERARKASKRSD
jgi:hypothetical protein